MNVMIYLSIYLYIYKMKEGSLFARLEKTALSRTLELFIFSLLICLLHALFRTVFNPSH